ncbi:MAG: acriflavin resistance protein [Candidatus Cloacimonadota bacterium]|nr:MAG: acriflavin resistance protein [Candidatus Cloacimonadota bacterium]
MIRYFASHKTASNLLMLLIVVLGLMTLPKLTRETFPRNKLDEVVVSVIYPGASALDVETNICLPIENAIEGISGIDDVECRAYENRAITIVSKFEDTNFSRLLMDVKTKVDAIKTFPELVEKPIVEKLNPNDPVASIALVSPMPLPELRHLSENIRDEIRQNVGLKLVTLQGFSQSQLRIELDESILRALSLSVQNITDIISRQNISMPTGNLEGANFQINIRVENEKRSALELGKTFIKKGINGKEIRLFDIATITNQFEIDEELIYFNNKPAIILKIEKSRGEDSIVILNKINKFIKRKNQEFPDGTSLTLTNDKASIVQDRLDLISKNGLQGLILVVVVLYFFFGLNFAIWVSMGLPVSFLGGLFFMKYCGVTINMLSLVGLLLGIGLLMDDAIVLSENIASHSRKGHSPLDSAVKGAKQVFNGVMSSFLTTVIMFGGLAFLDGNIGRVLRAMPIVLILILSVSLIEGFLILPNHLAHSLEKEQKISWIRKIFMNYFDKLKDFWVNILLSFALTYRYLFMSGVIVAFFFSISLLVNGTIKFQALPTIEGNNITARLLMPQGVSLQLAKLRVKQIIDGLDQVGLEHKKKYSITESLIENVMIEHSVNLDVDEKGPHVATISVDLLSSEVRKMSINEIIASWKLNIGEIYDVSELTIKEPVFGPGGTPIHVRFIGKDLSELSKISGEMKYWLRRIEGVRNVMDDLRKSKDEISLTLKPGALILGVDAKLIAIQLRAAFLGIVADEVSILEKNYEISVQINNKDKTSLSQLKNFFILNNQGKKIPLLELVNFKVGKSFSKITRVDGQRTVNVTADVDTRKANVMEILQLAKKEVFTILEKKYPDIKIVLEGEIKSSAETGSSMRRAFGLGLLGVFILLSLQFGGFLEPLIVIMAIPLALIGVLFGHVFMGYDFSMPSALGFISLAGIVVNDSILLVEFIHLYWKESKDLIESIKAAVDSRFRAIFLTSLTTIAGTAPLLLEKSVQVQILTPLVISLIFGMLSATLLILLVIPCLYAILNDFSLLKKADA